MILEIQIFGATAHARQSFHFQKILIFVDENWHKASFYIKEQTQKDKFEI